MNAQAFSLPSKFEVIVPEAKSVARQGSFVPHLQAKGTWAINPSFLEYCELPYSSVTKWIKLTI